MQLLSLVHDVTQINLLSNALCNTKYNDINQSNELNCELSPNIDHSNSYHPPIMAFFQWRRFNFFDLSKNCDNGKLSASLKVR